MAPQFVFPRTLEDLEQEGLEDDNSLRVQNPVDVASFVSSKLEEFVKGKPISLFRLFFIILKFQRFLSGVSFDLSDREILCIEEQDVFDRVYSLVRAFPILSPSSKLSLLETLRSNLAVLLPNVDSLSRASNDHVPIASHRNAFKIYSFFLLSILLALHSNTSKVRSL